MLLIFRKRNNKKLYFALIDATNIAAIQNKYSNLYVIKDQHFNSLFDKHILFFHKTKNKRSIELDKNFMLIERPFYISFQLLSHLKDLLFIIKTICEDDVSILRATSPFEMGLKGWLASKVTNVPFCISIHTDLDNRERFDDHVRPKILNSKKITNIIEQHLLKNCLNILPIRESMITYVENHGGKKQNCHVFPHGIDFSIYDSAINKKNDFLEKYELKSTLKIVSIVARLEKENYTEDLVKIINKILEIRNDVVFIIAGEGRDKKKFEEIQKNFNNYIKVLGVIPNEYVYLLRKLSSVNLCLMAGFALIEAAYSGNPCISYDVEWHYEIIKNKRTGFLINENDIKEVIENISYLLDHEKERYRMGKCAKDFVEDNYSLEKSNQIKKEIFIKMMDNSYVNS